MDSGIASKSAEDSPIEKICNESRSARKAWIECTLVILWMLVLSVILTRREWTSLETLPIYSMNVPTVPLFNAWTIGWNADQLMHGFSDYWRAPIFHPAPNAFAFSEPQPATLIVAPVVWATGSAVIGYKVWLLLSLFLNGFVTAVLLNERKHTLLCRIAGGTAMMLLPIIHGRIDVLQLVPVWGILWFWSCVFRMTEAATLWRGTLAGISFATCFALCTHHAMFLALLMVPACVVFLPGMRHRSFASASIVSVLVAATLILPIVEPIYSASREHDFHREDKLIANLSARPEHYLNSPPNSLIHITRFDGVQWRQFCVGWCRMAFAFVGFSAALFVRTRRKWTLFLGLITLFAFAFSLGLNLHVGGWKPWQWLMETVPGFAMVRSVFRFAWFVQIGVVLLAVEGLAAIERWCTAHPPLSRLAKLKGLCIPIAGLVIAFEIIPQNPARGGVPSLRKHREWVQFLSENVDDGKAVACLPFADGTDVGAYAMSTRWMMYGLQHRVPMVNGYSGFFPPEFSQLRGTIHKTFPSSKAISALLKFEVQYLVVRRAYCHPDKIAELRMNDISVSLVHQDSSGIDVYQIESTKP